jgi:hypothetical protein
LGHSIVSSSSSSSSSSFDLHRLISSFLETSLSTALGREPYEPRVDGTKTKTSIAIVLQNEPQSLFKALSCFALRDINLTKVEAQPASVARLMPVCILSKSRKS